MLQTDFFCEILKKCKENGIHTAVDTAGNVLWEYFERVLPYTDLFLYDVKAISEELHKRGTGVSNRLILENLEKLSGRKDIIVRIPLIGGFNDSETEVSDIAEFLGHIKCEKVEILPYHAMGEHKYAALNMAHEKYYAPDDIEKFREIFGGENAYKK